MSDYRRYFVKFIQESYPQDSQNIISETDSNYLTISADTAFALTSTNPMDRRLDFSAYFLALIKALDKRHESFDKIRSLCIAITVEYVRPKNKVQAFLKRLLPKLIGSWFGRIMIRSLHRRISRNSNPDGFIANIITARQQTYGFGYGIDIIECGICKLFTKHHCQKYAAILCEVDKLTSAMAGLELIRKGTIAQGFEICDFRFKRKVK